GPHACAAAGRVVGPRHRDARALLRGAVAGRPRAGERRRRPTHRRVLSGRRGRGLGHDGVAVLRALDRRIVPTRGQEALACSMEELPGLQSGRRAAVSDPAQAGRTRAGASRGASSRAGASRSASSRAGASRAAAAAPRACFHLRGSGGGGRGRCPANDGGGTRAGGRGGARATGAGPAAARQTDPVGSLGSLVGHPPDRWRGRLLRMAEWPPRTAAAAALAHHPVPQEEAPDDRAAPPLRAVTTAASRETAGEPTDASDGFTSTGYAPRPGRGLARDGGAG